MNSVVTGKTSTERRSAADGISLSVGESVCGRWNQGIYRVVKLLGVGANGQVYLVEAKGHARQVAMKIGFDNWQLQAEVNTLQHLEQERAMPEGGCVLLDNDCFQRGEKMIFFYIMNVVPGASFDEYVDAHGHEWLPAVGANLLACLDCLHRQGWVFGDLKPTHVRVDPYGRTQLIDYGGVARIGKSIKQYTPLFDRGCWQAGSRIADGKYDLFAYGIMLLQLLSTAPQQVLLPEEGLTGLRRHLDNIGKDPLASSLRPFIRKAIYGEFADCSAARKEWSRCCQQYGGGAIASGGKRTVSRGMIGMFACSAAFFVYAWLTHVG